jgi:hypothetical protein
MTPVTPPSNGRTFPRRWLAPLGLALVPLALYATYAFWSFQRYIDLTQYNMGPQLRESYKHHFALDKPVLAQYVTFLSRFLQLDFGPARYYRDGTFSIHDMLLPGLAQDWALPSVLLLLALALVFIRLRPARRGLGWILGLTSLALSTPNLVNLWFRPIHLPLPVLLLLFGLQLLALGVMLVWNAGPKPLGAVVIFLLGLHFLSVRYSILLNAALLALLVHYLRIWREIRLGTS